VIGPGTVSSSSRRIGPRSHASFKRLPTARTSPRAAASARAPRRGAGATTSSGLRRAGNSAPNTIANQLFGACYTDLSAAITPSGVTSCRPSPFRRAGPREGLGPTQPPAGLRIARATAPRWQPSHPRCPRPYGRRMKNVQEPRRPQQRSCSARTGRRAYARSPMTPTSCERCSPCTGAP
jgi:hypothetical protein